MKVKLNQLKSEPKSFQELITKYESCAVKDVTRVGKIELFEKLENIFTNKLEYLDAVKSNPVKANKSGFTVYDFNDRIIGFEDTEEEAVKRFLEVYPYATRESAQPFIYKS